MKYSLVNHDFEHAIRKMRRILPMLSFGLLIGTYLVSALIMGIFHAKNAPDWGFKIAAFLVPLAIQAGRGTLVFFFQLNPARMENRFSFGVIAATALLLLSLGEAYFIIEPYGISWTISVSTLMLIGWVIEIMILKETMFATQLEFYRNQPQWQEMKNFYIARKELERFVNGTLNKDMLPGSSDIQDEKVGKKKPLSDEKRKHLVKKPVEAQTLINNKTSFYGLKLDTNDPFLKRNLARLEMRFQERYQSSMEKENERKEKGRPAHKTILRSINENKERLEMTKQIRRILENGNVSLNGMY